MDNTGYKPCQCRVLLLHIIWIDFAILQEIFFNVNTSTKNWSSIDRFNFCTCGIILKRRETSCHLARHTHERSQDFFTFLLDWLSILNNNYLQSVSSETLLTAPTLVCHWCFTTTMFRVRIICLQPSISHMTTEVTSSFLCSSLLCNTYFWWVFTDWQIRDLLIIKKCLLCLFAFSIAWMRKRILHYLQSTE